MEIGDDGFYSINFEIPKNFYGNVELNLSISIASLKYFIPFSKLPSIRFIEPILFIDSTN